MGTLLNIVIGMSAIYLFVSLLVTSLQELIAQALALRARYLRVGIVKLLEQGKSDIGIIGSLTGSTKSTNQGGTKPTDQFYSNQLIQALATSRLGRTSDPSYVSKETFTSVALDLAGLTTSLTPAAILSVAQTLKAKQNASPLEYAIAVFAEEAGGNLKKLQARLGSWFDETMERVGGAYKRWTQIATIIIGVLLAGVLNIDSIAISQALLASPEQAARIADAAAKLSQSSATDPKLRDALNTAFEQAKIPLGWKASEPVSDWWLALFGWLLTGLAASLGSALWFDTLKRFVSIRTGGAKPSEKASSGS